MLPAKDDNWGQSRAPAPPPFDRSYWVVPGKLCAGFYPGDRDPARRDDKLGVLINCGIRHVVSLLEEDEVDFCNRRFEPYEAGLAALARGRGADLTMSRFPVGDMHAPERGCMKAILDDIDAALDGGRPVYLHCWGGLGRTGTVVGCWLARHGIARKRKALDMIDDLRKHSANGDLDSPQTAEQRKMVVSWRKGE